MGSKAQSTIHFSFSGGSCTEKMRTIHADGRMVAEEITKPDMILLMLHGLEVVWA